MPPTKAWREQIGCNRLNFNWRERAIAIHKQIFPIVTLVLQAPLRALSFVCLFLCKTNFNCCCGYLSLTNKLNKFSSCFVPNTIDFVTGVCFFVDTCCVWKMTANSVEFEWTVNWISATATVAEVHRLHPLPLVLLNDGLSHTCRTSLCIVFSTQLGYPLLSKFSVIFLCSFFDQFLLLICNVTDALSYRHLAALHFTLL